MLLRQLVDYRPTGTNRDREPAKPYSRVRTVRWELHLRADGTLWSLQDLADPSTRDTKNGRPTEVPHAGRTVAIAPVLGADDVQYVLGWVDSKTKPARVEAAHQAFVELCRRWARECADEPVAQAVVRFYARGGPAAIDPRPTKWTSKDLVSIVVDEQPVVECPSVWQLWSRIVEERKGGTAAAGGGRRGLCLVCGHPGILLNRLPQALPKALVPRAENDVAVVSANKPIHTFDFREGLGTAPICLGCGQAAVAHLHAILGDETHSYAFERQRTKLAWWVTHGGDERLIRLLNDDPDVIRDFLHGPEAGRMRRRWDGDAASKLCSVTLSGNVARLVVHDWIEEPLAEAEAAVERWFTDHKIADRWRGGLTGFPIKTLVRCAGQWQSDRGDPTRRKGRYIAMWDKAADRPDDLAQLLLHAALRGGPLPPHLLAHVVRRVRTDGHIDESRAALLRVALTRQPNRRVEAPMPSLEEMNTEPRPPAYVCGQLFAKLEATQHAAHTRSDQPNTSFFDRYFAGAITNPRIALIQGSQLSAAWLRKIRTSAERATSTDERNRRLAAYHALHNDVHTLFEYLGRVPLPARITTEEQSLFIIGYHHQRAHDLGQARARYAAKTAATDTDPTA